MTKIVIIDGVKYNLTLANPINKGDYVKVILHESGGFVEGTMGRVIGGVDEDEHLYVSEVESDRQCYQTLESLQKLTKEEYDEENKLISEGWIRHIGEENPTGGFIKVGVILANKTTLSNLVSSTLNWNFTGTDGDITHFRPTKQGKPTVWKPEKEERYYHIDGDSVCWFTCNNDGADGYYYKSGNCYKTKGQAERVVKNREIHQRLKEIADFEPDWTNSNQEKCWLSWEWGANKPYITFWHTISVPTTVYFEGHWYKKSQEITKLIDEEFGANSLEMYLKIGVI